MTFGCFLH